MSAKDEIGKIIERQREKLLKEFVETSLNTQPIIFVNGKYHGIKEVTER